MITRTLKHALKSWRLFAAAGLLLTSLGVGAYALNQPSTATFSARQNTTQQTNYHRFTINWNDARISSGVKFGRLPSNAFITQISCHVTTAFNAGTTNVVTLSPDNTNPTIIGPSSLDESSATFQNITTAAGLGVAVTSAGEVDLYAKYAQTGSAATAGSVTCVLEYIPNNDQ